METEFCTKVGNQVFVGTDMFADARVYGLFMVGIKGRQYALIIFHENPVIGCSFQSLLGNATQKCLWIVAGTAPEVLVKPCEQTPDLPVPAVEEVVGEIFQSFQFVGYAWPYFQCVACT